MSSLFISQFSHYLPDERIDNNYFLDINGLTNEWIFQRTGIVTRSRASRRENTNTMAIEAVKNLHSDLT